MSEWRKIDKFNYEISSDGEVRRLPGTSRKGSRVLVPGTNGTGYKYVALSDNGRCHTKDIHRLVAEVFIRPILEGEVVHHKDNNPSNNCLSNLEIVSHAENSLRAVQEGCVQYKISNEDVLAIKSLLREGKLTQDIIASMYNVTKITICRIKTNKRWTHIGGLL